MRAASRALRSSGSEGSLMCLGALAGGMSEDIEVLVLGSLGCSNVGELAKGLGDADVFWVVGFSSSSPSA